jgi:flagellar hook-basal body complex protein FliE
VTLEPLEPINALSAISMGSFLPPSQVEAPSSSFGDWFAKEVGDVNDKLIGAHLEAQKVAAGSNENLHEVMMHMQEARMSFEMMAQVRNRLLESYQEVMRMQV